jgi:hypothetical protein
MKGFCLFLIAVSIVLGAMSPVSATDFKPYPGAVLDEGLTKEAQEMAANAKLTTKTNIYATNDTFEKVFLFYKGMGKEYKVPTRNEGKLQTLPSGKEIKAAFVIFDGAKNLGASKLWVKIQRPYLGPKMEEGPDMTFITVSDKR